MNVHRVSTLIALLGLAVSLWALAGCGSVELAPLAAGDAGADLGTESAPDLGPPASDANDAENPASDAGAVEVAPPPPPPSCSTLTPTHENPCALECGRGCASCSWCGKPTGPTGCVAASGSICVASCSDCP